MALNITINKTAVAASYPAGSIVATAVASRGTTPYTYSLGTGGDYFSIDASTGVVTTKALMDASNIQSFSVTATDSNSTPESITSGVVYPNIQASQQSKFNKSNVIYKIVNDINLGNAVLTIPANCTLDFQGGSFSNGTIVGSNTTIISNNTVIFKEITFSGSFNIENVTESIFSYNNYLDLFYNISAISNENYYNKIVINNNYIIDSVPTDDYKILILKSNTDLILNGKIEVKELSYPKYRIIHSLNSNNIRITGGELIGDVETHITTDGEFGYGISLVSCSNVTITNTIIRKCWGDGIFIARDNWDSPTDVRPCKNILIENVLCDSNRRQGLSVTAVNGLTILNSQFNNTGTIKYTAPGYGIDIEPNNQWESCTNISIKDCQFNNNIDAGGTSDKSIVLYAPTYKNISNVNISNCSCSGTLSFRGAKNVTVNLCKLNQIYFTNLIKSDNILVSNCDINQDENFSYRNSLTLINNTWKTSAYISKQINLISNNLKLVLPKFRGTLKITVISNYATSNYAYDKEVLYKIDNSNSSYTKGYTKYLYTGSSSPMIGKAAIDNSVKLSTPIIDANGMVNIIFNSNATGVFSTIFIEIYELYTNGSNKIKYDDITYSTATAQEVTDADFIEYTLNTLSVATIDRPTTNYIGNIIYDTTLKKYICWNGTAWTNLDGTPLA